MDFEGEIKQALRKIGYQYKQYGGSQEKAYGTLEKIQQEYSAEPCEDVILDLMDFVTGFCSKNQRSWDEILTN